jgi:hypothetical protein
MVSECPTATNHRRKGLNNLASLCLAVLTLQCLYAVPHPTRGHNSVPWPYKETIAKGTKSINLVSKLPTRVLLGFLSTAHILCYTIYTYKYPTCKRLTKLIKQSKNPTFPTTHQSPITLASESWIIFHYSTRRESQACAKLMRIWS